MDHRNWRHLSKTPTMLKGRWGPMGGSSQALRLVEQECKRERHSQDGQETQGDSHTESSKRERTVSYMPKGSYHSDWDCELENLRQQVRELELKARSRCQRKSPEGSSHDHGSRSSYTGRSSHQSHSQLSKDRSTESRDKNLVSPRREKDGHPNFAMNAMSRALRRIVQSPFFEEIECTEMPRHFTRPPFTCYNGKTNTMEHIAILPNLWLSILGMMGYYARCSLLVLTTRQ